MSSRTVVPSVIPRLRRTHPAATRRSRIALAEVEVEVVVMVGILLTTPRR